MACVARKNDGTAVAWGWPYYGGNAANVDLTDVADAMCGGNACVARKNDGTAVAWGYVSWGGNAANVDLTNLAKVQVPTPSPAPTSSPTSTPTSSPTGSPTAVPTSTPTSSPTGSPTAAPTASPTLTVDATGDPHLQNVHGERFDLHGPGSYVLINIPRDKRADETLLRVVAEALQLGGRCSDIYFQELNVTGSWVEATRPGGYHYLSNGTSDTAAWIRVGRVDLKIVYGTTTTGIKYLNFHIKHLGQAGFVVGGLLGEEDHQEVSTPPAGCVNHVTLGANSAQQGFADSPVANGAQGSLE